MGARWGGPRPPSECGYGVQANGGALGAGRARGAGWAGPAAPSGRRGADCGRSRARVGGPASPARPGRGPRPERPPSPLQPQRPAGRPWRPRAPQRPAWGAGASRSAPLAGTPRPRRYQCPGRCRYRAREGAEGPRCKMAPGLPGFGSRGRGWPPVGARPRAGGRAGRPGALPAAQAGAGREWGPRRPQLR